MSNIKFIAGDSKKILPTLRSESVDCVVTSPPYWNLRNYDVVGQIGLESSWESYISNLSDIFKETKRVLKNTGTAFIVIGDKYDKHGNLIGLPFRLAFKMQEDGWIFRQDIIWNKPNPIPAGGKNPNKCTPCHEHILFFTKQKSGYFFDAQKIKEKAVYNGTRRIPIGSKKYSNVGNSTYSGNEYVSNGFRLKRDVWTMATSRFKGEHFAPFPEQLVETCVLAGCPAKGTVMDVFNGGGTTGVVSLKHDLDYIGIDINEKYIELSKNRLSVRACF